MSENRTNNSAYHARSVRELISFENTQRSILSKRGIKQFFFCRKTSIFQQLLQNKKDRFYVLNYVQTDTPDIDISRNVRKEFGFWVSLVHWRLCSYVQHLASILAPIFPKPRGHPRGHPKDIKIKLKWHLYNICSGMEPDGISSTSISSFWWCGIKKVREKTASSLFTLRD